MLISNVLFECDSVSVFKIPPGTTSLSKWQPKPLVWRGSARLLEEEQTAVTPESAPYLGLSLKLELFNKRDPKAAHNHFQDSEPVDPWAEVWFNPFLETELQYKIANDGSDTILMTPESLKYYRVITQLPGTGYCPLPATDKGFLLQVALGLQFEDLFSASSFSESLAIYKRHFRNFQQKFSNDFLASSVDEASLTLPSTRNVAIYHDDDFDDEDDDEFGSFIVST